MYTGKFLAQLTKHFMEKSVAIGTKVGNLGNPKVGQPLIKLQKPKLLLRVDGRSLTEFHQQGGLTARRAIDEVLDIRFIDVEQYQKYNKNPFAWGACTTFTPLEKFIQQNKSHTQNSWIHMFYGNASCLGSLKIETGIESDGYDTEHEQLVLEHLPFNQWLASTCPAYRTKFLDGKLVPNAMAEFNKSLPKSLRKSDLATEENILNWLLLNNSEEVFAELCNNLYTGVPTQTLAMRFGGDKRIVEAIEYFQKLSGAQGHKL